MPEAGRWPHAKKGLPFPYENYFGNTIHIFLLLCPFISVKRVDRSINAHGHRHITHQRRRINLDLADCETLRISPLRHLFFHHHNNAYPLLDPWTTSLRALKRGWGGQHLTSSSSPPPLIRRPSMASFLMECDLSCKARHDSAICIAERLSWTRYVRPAHSSTSVARASDLSLATSVSARFQGHIPHAPTLGTVAIGLIGLNAQLLLSKTKSDPKGQKVDCAEV